MNKLSLVFPSPLWHPSPVSARATLFGVDSVPAENSSILEFDCGDGGNILSIAASLPGAKCVGVSRSEEALGHGQSIKDSSGIENLELRAESAGEVDGTFDYIFLRSVYSRVTPEQRNELVSYYSSKLTENGIIVVEQLCLPGWHVLESIREQIRYHTRNLEDPHEKMLAGRQYLSALSQSVPDAIPHYRAIAEAECNVSRGVPDANFALEYFEEGYSPSFFHEFAASLEDSGLQYLCELSLGSMMINQFPAAMGSIVPDPNDLVASEQYLDFAMNRTRRMSLLCKGHQNINRKIEAVAIKDLYFSCSSGMPENVEEVLKEPEITLRTPGGGFVTVNDSAGAAAIMVLCAQFPKRLCFSEVLEAVRNTLGDSAPENIEVPVEEVLTACAATDLIQIDSIPGRACFELSPQPKVSALVRAQAEAGYLPYVSSLLHNMINVDQAALELLKLLDGTNGTAELIERFKEMIANGDLVVSQDGEGTDDEALIAEISEGQINSFLNGFLMGGLLES